MQRISNVGRITRALLTLAVAVPVSTLAQVDTRTPMQFPGRTTSEDELQADRKMSEMARDPADPMRSSRYLAPDVLEGVLDENTYLLGPADQLSVTIAAGQVRTELVPVLPEGVVVIPNVGVVPASGTTLAQFRQALHQAVSQRYQNFELYCHLARAREVRVYVTGEVNAPGAVVAKTYERVADLIERAGGFSRNGSHRKIELRSVDGELLRAVDLARYYTSADVTANPAVGLGQVIYVPTRVNQVEVIGQVARPGVHELLAGETLQDLLRLVGGPLRYADVSRVTVDQLHSDGTAVSHTFDLQTENPVLEDAVRVTLLSTLVDAPRVAVISPSGHRNIYFLAAGDSLRELAMRIGDFDESAQLSEAVLATRDEDGKPLSVPVDMASVLRGRSNHRLRNGDVLSIPGPRDFVYVSGYVARPGRYDYRSDWTVGRYIGEAGGTAVGGNLSKARVFHEDGSRSKMGREQPVRRGDTIYVDRSTGGKLVGGLAVLSNFSALIISIVALTR